MIYRVVVQPRAQRDIHLAAHWILGASGSPATAVRWARKLRATIAKLKANPQRCPIDPDSEVYGAEVRVLLHGKRGGVHRVLFTIQRETVHVLAVRHSAQRSLADELSDDDPENEAERGHRSCYAWRSFPLSLRDAALLPGVCMILIGLAAVWYWRRVSGARARWFWIGVPLWTVAVIIKFTIAILGNARALGVLKESLPHTAFVAVGALFIGIESSLCEIGLTLLAGLAWKHLGENAGRAVAVGVGAGAFEAVALGLANLAGVLAWRAGVPGTQQMGEMLQIAAATTPIFWLAGPVERVIAILVHAASRGLVLVGIRHARIGMIAGGFLIFTLVDSLAGGVQLSGLLASVSLWWIELLLSVAALISVPSIWWLHRRFGDDRGKAEAPAANSE